MPLPRELGQRGPPSIGGTITWEPAAADGRPFPVAIAEAAAYIAAHGWPSRDRAPAWLAAALQAERDREADERTEALDREAKIATTVERVTPVPPKACGQGCAQRH